MVKKKKFIDKKTALNYEMVHRDQRDPLTADENAAQNLLKPIDLEQKKKKVQFGEELSREEHARREYQAMKAALRDDMSEYNFPTDGYDYAQHMKESGGGTFIEAPRPKEKLTDADWLRNDGAEAEEKAEPVMLPSGLFASQVMLAAPVGAARNRLENEGLDLSLDPEVIAALDATTADLEDGKLEELLDDFVITAQEDGDQDLDSELFAPTDCFGNAVRDVEYASDEYCSDISGEEYSDDDMDDRRTNFTMTTSRRERGEQGRMLDEHFEKFIEAEYDDEELGELEDEETMVGEEGSLANTVLAAALDEFIEESGELELAAVGMDKKNKQLSKPELKQLEEANNMETVVTALEEEEEPEEQWDCETIVSTYSNLYNHPKELDQPRIRLSDKTGFAMDFLPDAYARKTKTIGDCIEEGDEDEEEEEGPIENKGVARRGESKDEKKARKKALKEEQRLRRVEKKDLKNEFKKESNLQKKEKIARGPQLRIRPIL